MTIEKFTEGGPESIEPARHIQLGKLRQIYYHWRITSQVAKLQPGVYSDMYRSRFSANVTSSSSIDDACTTVEIWEDDGTDDIRKTICVQVSADMFNATVNAYIDPDDRSPWQGTSLNLGESYGTAEHAGVPRIITEALSAISKLPLQGN